MFIFDFFGFGFIVWVLLLWWLISMNRRIRHLEEQIGMQRGENIQPVPAQGAPQYVADISYTSQPQYAATPQPQYAAPQKPAEDSFDVVAWFREDWLLKLGVLLLLLGFGWFVTYAFLNNWIGPVGRITLGIIAGIAILAVGWWRIQTYVRQGSLFIALGSTVILLTVYAARYIYDFFTPATALGLMFLSAAFVALASVRFNRKPLAVASIVLAGVAPILTHAPTSDYIGLFWYLMAVVLGTLWITALTSWRELNFAALMLVAVYSLPHLMSATPEQPVLLVFAYAFAAIFFVTNIIAIVREGNEGKDQQSEVLIAVGNGLFLLAWILTAAAPEWRSLIISAWLVVFLAAAFMVYRVTGRAASFYAHAAAGVGMLIAATSEELSGPSLTIAFTLEAAVVPILVHFVTRNMRASAFWSFLFVLPVILSFESIGSSAWYTGVFHGDFFVLFMLAMALLAAGWYFRQEFHRIGTWAHGERFDIALTIFGSAYAYMLLWLSLHAYFENDDTAAMFSLVVYTLVGLATHLYGRMNEHRVLRTYGGVLIGLVIVRMLLVEVWQMELTGRIITFFVIGLLLMGTAFIGRKRPEIAVSDPQS
ncbi:MAG: hypothetical protein RL681_660 [Candidatus Parcubacteria bacterium]|jgi:uncharacterized membrane protein